MTLKFDWLEHCIKEIDVTNIGKQHSLLNIIKAPILDKLSDLEL